MSKKTILYIGNFSFPNHNAPGKRVLANGYILRELGYEVIFIGTDKNISINDKIIDTKFYANGFEAYNFSYPNSNIEWFKCKTNMDKLVDFIHERKLSKQLDAVIYYAAPTVSLFNHFLIKWCKSHDVKIISDCVDWHIYKSSNKMFQVIKTLDDYYMKMVCNTKVDGVITISRYLNRYYKNKNMKTTIIPPLAIEKNECMADNSKVVFSYAGMPFKLSGKNTDKSQFKDRIDLIIEYLSLVVKEQDNFIFNIYGFTKEDYIKAVPDHRHVVSLLEDNIKFHGRMENDDVINEMQNSDFTILLRDKNRMTMAGFPTKVSESISCGIPVITNRTSDIDQYLTEGETVLFLDTSKTEDSVEKLVQIVTMSKEQRTIMKNKCYETDVFMYQKYISRMQRFLKKQ